MDIDNISTPEIDLLEKESPLFNSSEEYNKEEEQFFGLIRPEDFS